MPPGPISIPPRASIGAPLTGTVVPRPGSAAAAPARGAGVAVRDNRTHGDWLSNILAFLKALDWIWQLQNQMLAGLTRANADVDQIDAVRRWSDRVTVTATYIYDGMIREDGRIRPLVDEIARQGGLDHVADLGYYFDY